MTISLEQAQRITDLRQQMLRNIALGKPAHDGITPETLQEAIDILRQNRAVPAKAAAARARVKAEKAVGPVDPKFNDILSALD